jgi:hypothetical protein
MGTCRAFQRLYPEVVVDRPRYYIDNRDQSVNHRISTWPGSE